MLPMHSAPYFRKIAVRYGLDDLDLLTIYLIVSSSDGHSFLIPPSPCRDHVPFPVLSVATLGYFICFVGYFVCVQQGR